LKLKDDMGVVALLCWPFPAHKPTLYPWSRGIRLLPGLPRHSSRDLAELLTLGSDQDACQYDPTRYKMGDLDMQLQL